MVETVDGQTKVLVDKDKYERLVHNEKFLYALFVSGVDSWGGYESAQEIMDEDN